MNFH